MNSRFWARVINILNKGFWEPGRKNVELVERCVTSLGNDYVMFEAAEKAISEFGGLKIGFYTIGTDRIVLYFNPIAAIEHTGKNEWAKIVADYDAPTYPLGTFDSDEPEDGVFFITEDGKVYAEGICVYFLGNTLDEAIKNTLPWPNWQDISEMNPLG